jgi:hypothetical protein
LRAAAKNWSPPWRADGSQNCEKEETSIWRGCKARRGCFDGICVYTKCGFTRSWKKSIRTMDTADLGNPTMMMLRVKSTKVFVKKCRIFPFFF